MVRETAGFLMPLTKLVDDAPVTAIEFDLDLEVCAAGTIVLSTRSPGTSAELAEVRTRYTQAAALIVAPGVHAYLDEGTSDEPEKPDTPGTSTGPRLVERAANVTWAETLVHLRELVEGASSALSRPDGDDLGSLAAVIADSTGASITIEDPQSRVLAHVNLDDDIDEIRRETILTGAIPAWRIVQLEESGFLPAIRASTDVVERRAGDGESARSVIPLRSEGELLGTIWAAYGDAIDPDHVREVLREAARAARPVMLRTLRRSPFEKRIQQEALASILAGAGDLAPAAAMLALPFSGHYTAVAIAEVDPRKESEMRFHLRAAFADAVLAAAPGQSGKSMPCVAVLVQSSSALGPGDIRDRVAVALSRSEEGKAGWVFGVGYPVGRLDQVKGSWDEAVYALEGARLAESTAGAATGRQEANTPDSCGSRGVIAADLEAEILGLRVADSLGASLPDIARPAEILLTHDRTHQGQLWETLRVYFMTVGNSAEASRRLHVHANSLRHRLGRIEELTGLSPYRSADRLWLELAVLLSHRER